MLDDADFHEGVEILSKEPVPYFRQIGDRPATPFPSRADEPYPPTPPVSKEISPMSTLHSSMADGEMIDQWDKNKDEAITPLSVRSATPDMEVILPKDSNESNVSAP